MGFSRQEYWSGVPLPSPISFISSRVLADGTHQHADGHDVEHGFKQQVISRLHKGVEHLGQGHLVGQKPEESEEDDEEKESFNASFGGEP